MIMSIRDQASGVVRALRTGTTNVIAQSYPDSGLALGAMVVTLSP